MKRPAHIPTYVFLLSEYVAQLERIQYYFENNISMPHEVLKNIEERKEELKAITMDDLNAFEVSKEIVLSKSQTVLE